MAVIIVNTICYVGEGFEKIKNIHKVVFRSRDYLQN